MARILTFEKIWNFRDLGGYESRYGTTCEGIIYRSGTLCYASDTDLNKIGRLGIKTIIDFRDEETKLKKPDKAEGDSRFDYIWLQVNGKGRIPVDHDDQIASYMEMIEEPVSASNILRTILNCEKPCLIHCNAGKDRTGVFSMLLLLLNGVNDEVVNSDYMISFPLLHNLMKLTLSKNPDFPKIVTDPVVWFMSDFLSAFKAKYGNAEAYCRSIGLTDPEILGLKNILGREERSYGAVVMKDGKVLVELMAGGHYSIPKGHVETFDRDGHDTARREIKEETKLDVSFIDGFEHSIVYSPSEGAIKRVTFYLAETKQDEMEPQEIEVDSLIWMDAREALETLTYETDRGTVSAALEFLASKNQ